MGNYRGKGAYVATYVDVYGLGLIHSQTGHFEGARLASTQGHGDIEPRY